MGRAKISRELPGDCDLERLIEQNNVDTESVNRVSLSNGAEDIVLYKIRDEPYFDDFLETYIVDTPEACLLYTSPSPRDRTRSRMPSSA